MHLPLLASADRVPLSMELPHEDVVLDVQGLRTHFDLRGGVLKAVDDVSFRIRRGRTLCLVGESGSGKSVTARSILQIVPAPGRVIGGDVLLHRDSAGAGEPLNLARLDPNGRQMRAIRGREIAMIFQEPMSSLSPVHTIGRQIDEVLRLHTPLQRAERRERIVELLERVQIPGARAATDRYPFEYSGGMRQRAMIAIALACNPSILIADEPTTALDVTTQADILDLIKTLQDELRMSVLLITHDMGIVAEVGDDVCVMRRGKIVDRGPVQRVFDAPAHEYAEMLIASAKKLGAVAKPKSAVRREESELLLEVRDLSREFVRTSGFLGRRVERVAAVRNASLELREGETLGIVGESGSGKTTLGRCILKMVEPTSGSVRFRSPSQGMVDLARLERGQLKKIYGEMRLIFQDPYGSLNPRMTVSQIVGESLVLQGWPADAVKRRVAELLERVELRPEHMERYPHAFSGGQRQRIGIARALAPNPRLIVADEATSALDVSLRAQILDLLLSIQKELGLSFLFISHDISVVRYFCDRVAVMYRGEIVETGETASVCDRPSHAYTRALLSAVPYPDPRRKRLHQRHRYTGQSAIA